LGSLLLPVSLLGLPLLLLLLFVVVSALKHLLCLRLELLQHLLGAQVHC